MIRLNLSREPRRLDLGHSVAITVLPPTSTLMMAARRDAAADSDAGNGSVNGCGASEHTLPSLGAVPVSR